MPSLFQTQADVHYIFDNYNFGTVGALLKEHLEPNAELAFVSAYFTLQAYYLLKEELEGAGPLRFLFVNLPFLKILTLVKPLAGPLPLPKAPAP